MIYKMIKFLRTRVAREFDIINIALFDMIKLCVFFYHAIPRIPFSLSLKHKRK